MAKHKRPIIRLIQSFFLSISCYVIASREQIEQRLTWDKWFIFLLGRIIGAKTVSQCGVPDHVKMTADMH